MAVYPGAIWRGNCANNSGRRTAATRGAVVHVNDGPNVSLWGWVNNPSSSMSCHFQILQNGVIEQYLDTDLVSWCQKAGNNAWVSIEMPTHPDVGMTAAQIASAGKLIAWLAGLYRFPLALAVDPNGYGIGWHGMGAHPGYPDDWGHPLCPGVIRRGQLPAVQKAALAATTTTPEDDYAMPGYSSWSDADKKAFWADGTREIITRSLAGYGFAGSFGQAVLAAVGQAKDANVALNDPTHGVVVTLARIDAGVAQLPTELQTLLDQHPATAGLDAEAVVDALFIRFRALLDGAPPTGSHAAAPAATVGSQP